MRISRTVTSFASLLAVCFSVPMTAQTAQTGVPLHVGTRIPVTSATELSSKTAKDGEKITLVVRSDVIVGGHTLVAKGTSITGTVTDAQGAGRFGKGGQLAIAIDPLKTADGQSVVLIADLRDTATVAEKEQSQAGALANKIPGADVATGIFKKGGDVTFKAQTLIPVFTLSYAAVSVPGAANVTPTTSSTADTVAVAAPVTAQDSAAADSAAAALVSPTAIALFDVMHSWHRAIAAVAAHVSTTPAVRDFGQRVAHDDSLLQEQGLALATQSRVVIPPLDVETQTKLNTLLASLRAIPEDKFDQTILQQMYEFENNFIDTIDEEDASPLGKLLASAAPVWKDHMTKAAQLLVPAAKK